VLLDAAHRGLSLVNGLQIPAICPLLDGADGLVDAVRPLLPASWS
jgi:hypothetical protein